MTRRTTRPTRPDRPPTAHGWVVGLRRALRRHRRKLAVLATLAAVLTGLTALAPPRPDTVAVVTAARPLDGGHTVTADDLTRTALPPQAVPDGSWTDPADVIGRTLAGPIPPRQVLVPASLLRERASGTGSVVAPLPLADPRVARLVEAGDQVDVLAADSQSGKTKVVATAVRVVTGGIGGDSDTTGSGGLVLVDVDLATATALAAAAASSSLSVVWR
ncbi:MAG: SAF domain-containing protein [Microlunatus sp.]